MTTTGTMSVDEQLEMMTKLRNALDVDCLHPLDRKAVIIMLTANFIVTTNEIWGGDRAKAHKFAENIHENVKTWVDAGIDSGGMRLDGFDKIQ